jgi:hypothetical protein
MDKSVASDYPTAICAIHPFLWTVQASDLKPHWWQRRRPRPIFWNFVNIAGEVSISPDFSSGWLAKFLPTSTIAGADWYIKGPATKFIEIAALNSRKEDPPITAKSVHRDAANWQHAVLIEKRACYKFQIRGDSD